MNSVWRSAVAADTPAVERVLRLRERECVSAASRFREGECEAAWVMAAGGVALYAKPTLYPVRAASDGTGITRSLLGRLYALHGPADAVARFVVGGEKETVNYTLFALDTPPAEAPLPNGITLRNATPADEDALLPLQLDYQAEEITNTPPNKRVTRFALARILKHERIIVALRAGRIIGKANTNAHGFTRWQLGGVYVAPDERCAGVATALVAALSRNLLSEDGVVGITLFARKHNAPALALYRSVGYQIIGDYAIVYY
jgi:predicted GNAT family acetyltransferase